MASSTKVPLSFEEFWARRTEEYAYFNETSLRNYLQVLVRIEPEPMERSSTVRTVSGMLRLYGGTCRMHIGHDGSLEYALKTWRDRDEDGNFRPLMRWFEEVTSAVCLFVVSTLTKYRLQLRAALSMPRGLNAAFYFLATCYRGHVAVTATGLILSPTCAPSSSTAMHPECSGDSRTPHPKTLLGHWKTL